MAVFCTPPAGNLSSTEVCPPLPTACIVTALFRNSLCRTSVISVAVGAALTLVPLISATGCRPNAADAGAGRRQAGPPQVTVALPLSIETIDWDPYTGRLAPIEEVEVRARVNGYLMSYHFEEGQPVEQGQLLFVIDPRPYEATLAMSRAAQEEAEARLNASLAQVREAEANRKQVQARLELARARLKRARRLAPTGAISEDEIDEIVAIEQQAEADEFAAVAAIESAHAAVTAAEAVIATAEAAVTASQLDVNYCRITAPIAGRIGQRLVTEGNLVSGGQGSALLTTIVTTNPIHAYFDADEQALLKYIRLDQQNKRAISRDVKNPVFMAMVDEKGYQHEGYIDFVDNRVDAATGSIRARAIFPNDDESLVPGVFVRLQVPGSGVAKRLLLPDSAISIDQASKFVYVVDAANLVHVRRVTTGDLAKGLRVITDGLDGSETVVIKGVQRCRPGQPVEPARATLEAGPDLGLPDTYEPVPREKWLRPAAPAAELPATAPTTPPATGAAS
jgi:RND family efflux transporter MFP subunit